MLLEKLLIRRHHDDHRPRPYRRVCQPAEPVHLSLVLVQRTLHLVCEVAVGDHGDESDARVRDLAHVKGFLPLPDNERVGRKEQAGDFVVGDAEGAAYGASRGQLGIRACGR